MLKITNDRLNLVWQRMLCSCTHMAAVDVTVLMCRAGCSALISTHSQPSRQVMWYARLLPSFR